MFHYIQHFLKDSKSEYRALKDICFPLAVYQTLIRAIIIAIFGVSYNFFLSWILKNPSNEVFITGFNSINYIHIDRFIVVVVLGIFLFLLSFFIENLGVLSLSRQYYFGKKVTLRKTFLDIVKFFRIYFKVQTLKYIFILFNLVGITFLVYVIFLFLPNIFGFFLAVFLVIQNIYIIVQKIIEYKDVGQKVFENKKNIFEIYGYKMNKKRKIKILKFYIFKIILIGVIVIFLPFLWLYMSEIIAKYSFNHQITTSVFLGINFAIAIIIATIISYLYISFFTLRATRVYLEIKQQKASRFQAYKKNPFIRYKKTLFILFFIALSILESLFYFTYFQVYVLENKSITIFAHRASMMKDTNNSFEALEYSIKHNIEYVEIDTQLSKEGIPVVFHDYTYFDGKQKKYIHNTPLQELKQFDLKQNKNTSTQNTERIPTLEEFLQRAKGKIKVNIEIKTTENFEIELAEKVTDVIKQLKVEKEVLVTSFDYKILKKIKELLPNVELGLIITAYVGDLEEEKIHNMDIDWIMVNDIYYFLNKNTFDDLGNKKIALWSFSSDFDGEESLYENISGVIVDNPVQTKQELEAYNNLPIGEKYYKHIEYIFLSRILKEIK